MLGSLECLKMEVCVNIISKLDVCSLGILKNECCARWGQLNWLK